MSISKYIPEELFRIFAETRVLRESSACVIVGGAIRDALRGIQSTDFDVEVYGVREEDLQEGLSGWGKVCSVGKCFGVIKLKTAEGRVYDFSLPRRDSKVAQGHKGFKVQCDPELTFYEAASRRDFTINAILYDLREDKLIDLFNGERDLRNGVLRHVGSAFVEDPLRVLRGMQFVSRLNLRTAPETIDLCRRIISTYSELSKERIYGEWEKWAVKSEKPSLGIKFLEDTGWLKHYPDLLILREKVFESSYGGCTDWLAIILDVCDRLVLMEEWKWFSSDTRIVLLFSALCLSMDEKESFNEEELFQMRRDENRQNRESPTVKFLFSVGIAKWLQKRIFSIKRGWSFLRILKNISPSDIRKLAYLVYPESIQNLICLCKAFEEENEFNKISRIEFLAKSMGIETSAPVPLLKGELILEVSGLPSGPHIGKIQSAAFIAQLDGEFMDISSAKVWLKKYLKTYET